MPATKSDSLFDAVSAFLHAYDTNDRINAYLIAAVPDEAWTASQPNGKGRTIAAIAAHMHNVRLMWLKANGVAAMPDKLEADGSSKQAVVAALESSRAALALLLEKALRGDGKIKSFKPDVASFFSYLIAHDAHHRGQITMLARQVGHPIPKSVGFGLWEWGVR